MVIKPVDLFHTPKDWKYIEKWIERHGLEDRVHLWTAACMAWNLAASIVNEEETDNDGTPDV